VEAVTVDDRRPIETDLDMVELHLCGKTSN
jgi:hypothetical protein